MTAAAVLFSSNPLRADVPLVVPEAMLTPALTAALSRHAGGVLPMRPPGQEQAGRGNNVPQLVVLAGKPPSGANDDKLVPVGLVASAPMVLLVRTGWSAAEGGAAIAQLKADAARVRLVHNGRAAASFACGVELQQQMGVAFVMTDSAKPAQALATNDGDVTCLAAPIAVPLVQSGLLTGIAVAAEERLQILWDTPAAGEVGLPLFAATEWLGFYVRVPAGATPDDAMVAKANVALQAFLADVDVVDQLAERGLTPFPLTHRSTEAHRAFLASAAERAP